LCHTGFRGKLSLFFYKCLPEMG